MSEERSVMALQTSSRDGHTEAFSNLLSAIWKRFTEELRCGNGRHLLALAHGSQVKE
jgi:hypothetical protein